MKAEQFERLKRQMEGGSFPAFVGNYFTDTQYRELCSILKHKVENIMRYKALLDTRREFNTISKIEIV
jgi:hypothetical protein